MTGYSTKTLSQKLGLKENQIIVLLDMPENYGNLLHPIPAGVSVYDTLQPHADFIQIFTTSAEELDINFDQIKQYLKDDGSLWVSWMKAKKGQKQQLNEDTIREIGLNHGLVDVKVIAVDDIWSALKFVYRLKDR